MSAKIVQDMIDNYASAGANLLVWLTLDNLAKMPKPRKHLFGLITIQPSPREYQEWADDIACEFTFQILREVKDRLEENEPD